MADIEIRRHTGVVAGTGSRIFLVFRKIPDDEENCLVVMADSLPDYLAQNLDNIVMSREAQAEVDLYNVLARRLLNNGRQVLSTLHENKLLTKVPISTVEMTPIRGHTVPLAIINDDIDNGGKAKEEEEAKAKADVESLAASAATMETSTAAEATKALTPAEQAKAMMAQAQEMKKMADDLKIQALALDPNLKAKKGRPAESNSEEAKKTRRNEKRRAAYQKKKKAAESK